MLVRYHSLITRSLSLLWRGCSLGPCSLPLVHLLIGGGVVGNGEITVSGRWLFRRLDDTETGITCALFVALGHAAPLGLGELATQMDVSDSDQRPVRLVCLLLYEAAQFLDEFRQMSQTPLHSLLQHVVYAHARVICPFRAPRVQFVAFDAARCGRCRNQSYPFTTPATDCLVFTSNCSLRGLLTLLKKHFKCQRVPKWITGGKLTLTMQPSQLIYTPFAVTLQTCSSRLTAWQNGDASVWHNAKFPCNGTNRAIIPMPWKVPCPSMV